MAMALWEPPPADLREARGGGPPLRAARRTFQGRRYPNGTPGIFGRAACSPPPEGLIIVPSPPPFASGSPWLPKPGPRTTRTPPSSDRSSAVGGRHLSQDSCSIVGYRNHDSVQTPAGADIDPTGLRACVRRVIDQARPHLVEIAAGRMDLREFRLDLEPDVSVLRPDLRLFPPQNLCGAG